MTITTAYRAALANADPAAAVLDTIELYHPDWPAVVRLVDNREDLTATLEATAPNNPGAIVTFTAFPIAVTVPRTGDGPQDINLTITNATRLLMPSLEGADLSDPEPIRVIWRPFVTTDLTQPGLVLGLAVKSFTADDSAVVLSCGLIEFANRRFPRYVYKDTVFIGLAERI